MREFKIRCSAIGQIMTEPRSKSEKLSQTCKTYIETWLKEQLYERRKEFTSKYTQKGTTVEDDAIELASEVYGWGMVSKNERFFEDEFMTGTPDIILARSVDDIKSSWDCFTFPLFEGNVPEKNYWWQLQGYMALTGKESAGLHYCLMDAPESLVDREARSKAWQMGLAEVDGVIYDQIKAEMTYSHLPYKLRIKSFTVERDEDAIELVKARVLECRNYIAEFKMALFPPVTFEQAA